MASSVHGARHAYPLCKKRIGDMNLSKCRESIDFDLIFQNPNQITEEDFPTKVKGRISSRFVKKLSAIWLYLSQNTYLEPN